jgi:hypothetical protein
MGGLKTEPCTSELGTYGVAGFPKDSGTMCRMPIDSIDSSVCTLLSRIVSALVDQTGRIDLKLRLTLKSNSAKIRRVFA